MEKPRLHHFDVVKGFAIFLVVIGHILTFCIRDIDRAPLFKFIGLVHMPMFFFISGYFTYKHDFALPKLISRFRQLIIPGVVMLFLWTLYFPHSGVQSPLDMTLEGTLVNEYKNGYWFPYVLFVIILIYTLTTPVLRSIRSGVAGVLFIAAVCIIINVADNCFATPYLNDLFSLSLIAQFTVPFMFGVFCRRHSALFDKMITRSPYYTCSLIAGSLSLFFLAYRWDYPFMEPFQPYLLPLFHLALPIAVMTIAQQWCNTAFASPAGTRWGNIWKLLGRESLAIYLLHYFFLFPLPWLQEPLRNAALDIVPTLIVTVPLAAVVVTVTLGVNYLIARSPLLAQILTGQLNTQKK
ncbi:MAG: acyltransferase [Muribaculaceae bacterium]|nr:acyltransferase [Muribaculaceae bacterium]